MTYFQGSGRRSPEVKQQLRQKDYQTCMDLIKGPFFHGEEFTTIDATVFGFLQGAYDTYDNDDQYSEETWEKCEITRLW